MKNRYRIIKEFNSYHIECRSFFLWRNIGETRPDGTAEGTFVITYFSSVEDAKRYMVKLEEKTKKNKQEIVYRATWKNGKYIIKDKGGF